MKHVELSSGAEKDLRQLDRKICRQVAAALHTCLMEEPPAGNTDIKALRGAPSWCRLRVGSYRVLYRLLTDDELEHLGADLPPVERPVEGYLVHRIIHRRDLEQAAATL